ncbi:MAG: RNA polymerase sigma factor [Phycisphaerales bacterium]
MRDAELISECLQAGSAERYRELVERHTADVRAFVRSQLAARSASSLDDPDEVTVEAFTRAWLSLGSLRDRDVFASWVKGIAARVLKEHSRTWKATGSWKEMSRQDAAGDPALSEAIERLPAELRGVIELRFFGGLSCEKIAAREGVAIGTVTKRLSRAYTALRERLGEKSERVSPPSSSEVSR